MKYLLSIIGIAILASCSTKKNEMDLKSYELTNANGMKVVITNFGGRVVSLLAPDKNGKLEDVVLGYDSLKEYLKENPYFGALIGRYGNRIAKGKFTLGGKEYHLPVNNGENSLHGGPMGFHNVYWEVTPVNHNYLKLTYHSKDGEAGYPGNLLVTVGYTLTETNEFSIDYEATADKETVVNLTHHSYFNLAGAGNGDILNHELTIYADYFNAVDSGLIPAGEPKSVEGTPFDFTTPHKIGERINQDDEQLKFGKGYDHNWVLRKARAVMWQAARVVEPASGRIMDVWTTEPGMQFYSGNFLDKEIGKGGKAYPFRSGFCLETQHFPDSPNRPDFPSTVLKPGEKYFQKTLYKFDVVK